MDVNDKSYGMASALTVATPAANTIGQDADPVRGILIGCSVAGNAVLKLDDGTSVTIDLVVGTLLLPLCVVEVVSATATATFYQLG